MGAYDPQNVTVLVELSAIEKMAIGKAVTSLRREGVRVLAVERSELEALKKEPEGCWIAFGFIRFIREARRHLAHQPLAYFSEDRFYFSRYAHKLPRGVMLNEPGLFLPCAAVVNQAADISGWFGADRAFIRPDSGLKVFTGVDVSLTQLRQEVHALQQVSSLTDDTIIFVAPYRLIHTEYRVFIVNREVISASQYSFSGETSGAVTQDVLDLAGVVAKHRWQIDVAYSCDIAVTDEGLRVVELNAGSTSGFYACDAKKVIKAMMESAWLEYQGELSVED
jgi:hypothetical protein